MKDNINYERAAKLISEMKLHEYFEIEYDYSDSSKVEDLKKQFAKYKLKEFSPDTYQRENIFKYGLTNIVNPQYENLIGKPEGSGDNFIVSMQKFVDKIIKGNSLIIIDRYIFPDNHDSDYPTLFNKLLNKYYSTLKQITFVTTKSLNQKLQSQIFNDIRERNPDINLVIKHNELFHDRFWINPKNEKGVFVGTSLNGFGKKYTLIDYISDEDVREILKELKK